MSLTRRTRLVATAIAGIGTLVTVGGGFAAASGRADASGVIHACERGNGSIRIVDSFPCDPKTEAPLQWNQKGQTGPKGDTGAPGETGPAGPAGASGRAGTFRAQTCPAGQFVNGIDTSGTIQCAAPTTTTVPTGFPPCMPFPTCITNIPFALTKSAPHAK